MRTRTLPSFAVPVALALALVGTITSHAAAQDYVQYEVERLKQLPGSTVDLGQRMVEHNQRFHYGGPTHGRGVLHGYRPLEWPVHLGDGTDDDGPVG